MLARTSHWPNCVCAGSGTRSAAIRASRRSSPARNRKRSIESWQLPPSRLAREADKLPEPRRARAEFAMAQRVRSTKTRICIDVPRAVWYTWHEFLSTFLSWNQPPHDRAALGTVGISFPPESSLRQVASQPRRIPRRHAPHPVVCSSPLRQSRRNGTHHRRRLVYSHRRRSRTQSGPDDFSRADRQIRGTQHRGIAQEPADRERERRADFK